MSKNLQITLFAIGVFGISSAIASPDLWHIDYEKSSVNFFAQQAGAEFEGRWRTWDAEIRFDPQQLDASHASARFHVESVDTRDAERDHTLRDAEWFDGEAHPIAHFETQSFSAMPDGRFKADSMLTIKALSMPLTFHFRYSQEANQVVLEGEAKIDRLAAGLGLGEWSDTSWIGQFVQVRVMLHALARKD